MRSELFTRKAVLDLFHDYFLGAEFGKVLIKHYKYRLVMHPKTMMSPKSGVSNCSEVNFAKKD